ncbi:MAG: bifunctional nuclease family protein [Bacteroidales bacterium]|nr:bifunctional nuclease family protein [Bacteroidales bacterium]
MKMEKIKLEVLGLSYSQTQAGAYALILAVEGSQDRIPIIIGGFEAQSIAIELEKLNPPRPLTHDLFVDFAKNFDINLKEVLIYKFEEGIFYSKIYFEKDGNIKEIDSRTSDAVAIALRFKSPIYTTIDIVQKTGITLNFSEEKEEISKFEEETLIEKPSEYESMTTAKLKTLMNKAIANEDYEKASLIRDVLKKRNVDF